MSAFKRLARHPFALRAAGELAAAYLHLVRRTSRWVEGAPGRHPLERGLDPYIAVTWHGEHFLNPFARRESEDVRVLVSRHGDGEINAVAARRMGVGLVRGSGEAGSKRTQRTLQRRGGAAATRALLKALAGGASIAMTADVPKVSRRTGLGAVTLARLSGRPVVPFAVVSRRRIRLNSWDRAALPLPFSRLVFLPGEPVFVARDADAEAQEAARQTIDDQLNALHERATRLADARPAALRALIEGDRA